MHKRIIICSDGTWNSPEKHTDHQQPPTNILKLARAIEPYDKSRRMQQVVYYSQGIGADTFGRVEKLLRGLSGWGIKQNILDCYRFIAHNYNKGDELYLLGFSRGAYTVRSLCGLLDAVGLLAKTDLDQLPLAYEYYRKAKKQRAAKRFKTIRALKGSSVRPTITCLGVFDTVGALGLPTPLLGRLLKHRVSFHNTSLSPQVERAYQALAVDEMRAPFAPAPWTRRSEQSHVQQVWFSGAHCDVGGGTVDTALADTPLHWMMLRAMECGLSFNQDYFNDPEQFLPDPMGPIENSFSLGYRLLEKLRLMPRALRTIGERKTIGEMIHESVIARMQTDPDYRPANLIAADSALDKLLGTRGDHATLKVHATTLPVSRQRQQVRVPTHLDATLAVEGQDECICEVVDLSREGGAKIHLEKVPKPGQVGVLKSTRTGDRKFNVVWTKDSFSGVQFLPS